MRTALPFLAVVTVLAAFVVQTRVAHVRGLVLPPWVDPIHHTMITMMILGDGGIPSTYDPWIAGAPFAYHFGFHANLAVLCAFLGRVGPEDVANTMLHFGQLLNALVFASLYAGGRALLRSRTAALLAATIGTLVSWFPAYYVSWGRYPHLAGLLLLPALVLLWRFALSPRLGTGVAATLLLSGLVLTHVRVAAFAAVLVGLLTLALLSKRQWRPVGVLALCSLVAVLLVLPFATQVARSQELLATIAGNAPLPEAATHRTIQNDLLWAPNNRILIAVATAGVSEIVRRETLATTLAGIAWWLLLVVLAERQKRRGSGGRTPWMALLLLVAWCVAAVALPWVRLGTFDLSRAVSVNSTLITLFVPLSLATAALVGWVIDQTAGRWSRHACMTVILLIALAGTMRMQHIVRPSTVLASPDDVAVLLRAGRSLPASSVIATSYRPWLGDSWVGDGGGAWIPVLSGMRAVVPPPLYAWSLPRDQVDRINRSASSLSGIEHASWREIVERCRAAGATHFYASPVVGDDEARASLVIAEGTVALYAIPGP